MWVICTWYIHYIIYSKTTGPKVDGPNDYYPLEPWPSITPQEMSSSLGERVQCRGNLNGLCRQRLRRLPWMGNGREEHRWCFLVFSSCLFDQPTLCSKKNIWKYILTHTNYVEQMNIYFLGQTKGSTMFSFIDPRSRTSANNSSPWRLSFQAGTFFRRRYSKASRTKLLRTTSPYEHLWTTISLWDHKDYIYTEYIYIYI